MELMLNEFVCRPYLKLWGCDEQCQRFHFCVQFLLNQSCDQENCFYDHNILSRHNARVLRYRFCELIEPGDPETTLFNVMHMIKKTMHVSAMFASQFGAAFFEREDDDSEDDDDIETLMQNKQTKSKANKTEPDSKSNSSQQQTASASKANKSKTSADSTQNSKSTSAAAAKAKEAEFEPESNKNKPRCVIVPAPDICLTYLSGKCTAKSCQNLHPKDDLTYVWQYNVGSSGGKSATSSDGAGSWIHFSTDNTKKLEAAYCKMATDAITVEENITKSSQSCEIIFDEMTATVTGTSQPILIRRISCPSSVSVPKNSNHLTVWRWFKNSEKGYQEFNKAATLDLEKAYLNNNEGKSTLIINRKKVKVDFSSMEITGTGADKADRFTLRRRPKEQEEVKKEVEQKQKVKNEIEQKKKVKNRPTKEKALAAKDEETEEMEECIDGSDMEDDRNFATMQSKTRGKSLTKPSPKNVTSPARPPTVSTGAIPKRITPVKSKENDVRGAVGGVTRAIDIDIEEYAAARRRIAPPIPTISKHEMIATQVICLRHVANVPHRATEPCHFYHPPLHLTYMWKYQSGSSSPGQGCAMLWTTFFADANDKLEASYCNPNVTVCHVNVQIQGRRTKGQVNFVQMELQLEESLTQYTVVRASTASTAMMQNRLATRWRWYRMASNDAAAFSKGFTAFPESAQEELEKRLLAKDECCLVTVEGRIWAVTFATMTAVYSTESGTMLQYDVCRRPQPATLGHGMQMPHPDNQRNKRRSSATRGTGSHANSRTSSMERPVLPLSLPPTQPSANQMQPAAPSGTNGTKKAWGSGNSDDSAPQTSATGAGSVIMGDAPSLQDAMTAKYDTPSGDKNMSRFRKPSQSSTSDNLESSFTNMDINKQQPSPVNKNRSTSTLPAPTICIDNLYSRCKNGKSCPQYHSRTHYQWQMLNMSSGDGNWVDYDRSSNTSIETAYCNVYVHKHQHKGDTINFSEMTVSVKDKILPLRRLTTPHPTAAAQQPQQHHTTWCWYRQSEDGKWHPYNMEGLIKSDRIERRYQEKGTKGNFDFCADHGDYIIDFDLMIQKNVDAKTQHNIRRRPEAMKQQNEQKAKHSQQAYAVNYICADNLLDGCSKSNNKCAFFHSSTHYQWQYKAWLSWKSFSTPINAIIERAYCDPNNTTVLFHMNQSDEDQSEVNFANMTGRISSSEAVSVRRLSVKLTQQIISQLCDKDITVKWLWYQSIDNKPWRLVSADEDQPDLQTRLEEAYNKDQNSKVVIHRKDNEHVISLADMTEYDSKNAKNMEYRRRPSFTINTHQPTDEVICVPHLTTGCTQDIHCTRYHCDAHYQWLYTMHTSTAASATWSMCDKEQNAAIEELYSNPAIENISIDIEGCLFTIDLQTMLGKSTADDKRVLMKRIEADATQLLDDNPAHQAFIARWCWYWQDNDAAWTEYQGQLASSILETHYKTQRDATIHFTAGSHYYTLNLVDMEQKNDATGTARPVRRRPKARPKAIPQPPTLPDYWRPVAEAIESYKEYDVFDVPSTSDEYKKIAELFSKTMCTVSSTNSYAHLSTLYGRPFFQPREQYKINSISRIQNAQLWDNYCRKKTQMEASRERAVREELLFHGTRSNLESVICKQGFDWRVSGSSNATKFGKGSYFARDASYSHGYARDNNRLFVVQTLVGDYAQGSQDCTRPPPRDARDPLVNLYDSCVNNIYNPSIYVIFDLHQSYPAYIIDYKPCY